MRVLRRKTIQAIPIGLPKTKGWVLLGGFRSRLLLSLSAVVVLTALLVGGLGFVRFQDTLSRKANKIWSP